MKGERGVLKALPSANNQIGRPLLHRPSPVEREGGLFGNLASHLAKKVTFIAVSRCSVMCRSLPSQLRGQKEELGKV